MDEILAYQRRMLQEERTGFLDYDRGQNWLFFVPYREIWDDTLDLVRMEAKRLHDALPKLGNKAVIMRTSGGWHLIFPDADLTWGENEALMHYSLAHKGYIRYSILLTDNTLRVGPKRKSPKPTLKEIIYLNRKEKPQCQKEYYVEGIIFD